jgi:hypothetical protein
MEKVKEKLCARKHKKKLCSVRGNTACRPKGLLRQEEKSPSAPMSQVVVLRGRGAAAAGRALVTPPFPRFPVASVALRTPTVRYVPPPHEQRASAGPKG